MLVIQCRVFPELLIYLIYYQASFKLQQEHLNLQSFPSCPLPPLLFYFPITWKLCWQIHVNIVSFFPLLYYSKQDTPPLCNDGHDASPYYQPLVACITGTTSKRWIPIQKMSLGFHLNSAELQVHGKYCLIAHYSSWIY